MKEKLSSQSKPGRGLTVTQIEFGVETEPCEAKPVLVLLASKFVHHITGKSPGKTNGNVSYCYQSPWTKILEIRS